jgi:hypothetical protein
MMDDVKKQELAVELARFRKAADEGDLRDMFQSFKKLDDGGVFQELDEYTGYAAAEDVLRAADEADAPRKDPAEWGDSSGYAQYGGDHLDARGATFHGPVTGKVVSSESVRLGE